MGARSAALTLSLAPRKTLLPLAPRETTSFSVSSRNWISHATAAGSLAATCPTVPRYLMAMSSTYSISPTRWWRMPTRSNGSLSKILSNLLANLEPAGSPHMVAKASEKAAPHCILLGAA